MPDKYHFFQNKIDGKANQIYDFAPSVDSRGDLEPIEGIDVVIRSIRTLLLTPLGHYPFDPEFGSLLYKKIFEMADGITEDEIKFECSARVQMWDDRVNVTEVESYFTADGKTVVVNVHIERNGIPGKVSLTFSGGNRMFGLEDDITAGLQ